MFTNLRRDLNAIFERDPAVSKWAWFSYIQPSGDAGLSIVFHIWNLGSNLSPE